MVVLETPQIYTRDGVAGDVNLGSLGEENVGLIQEKHPAALVRRSEVVLEAVLDFHGRLADITTCNWKQRSFRVISNTLGLAGLANTGRAV